MALTPLFRDFFDTWNNDWQMWQGVRLSKTDLRFSPSIDVKETDTDIIVHAELAGIPKENIHVDFANGALKLSGNKEERKEEKDVKWHRVESRSGSFSRIIALPQGTQANDISAKHNDGVLEIVVKKPAPESGSQKIAIN